MKLAIYGLPCSGKTYILDLLKKQEYIIINGSEELNKLSNYEFRNLSNSEQEDIRIKYAKYIDNINTKNNVVISDGHYSFGEQVVFTDEDANLYDSFIYIYCKPEVIKERLDNSNKNKIYSNNSVESIKKWQNFEINSLRSECHQRNKDFYVIDDTERTSNIKDFIKEIIKGFSSYEMAKEICNKIIDIYPQDKDIILVDGDKTIIKQDSFRYCCNKNTNIFNGNFYTGYQSFLFYKEVCSQNKFKLNDIIISKINDLELNKMIFNKINKKNYVVISAGIQELWEEIKNKFLLKNVIANQLISADTKYFIAKILKEKGYIITAYGDSKIDIYMLEVAHKGYLYINGEISNSLKETAIKKVNILQNLSPYILENNEEIIEDNLSNRVRENISICKSNSGITGAKLAKAHLELGEILGNKLKKIISGENTAILVLDRGGRFFGDGIFLGFGGKFYPFNPKIEKIPNIKETNVIIVDSVINTGKSIIHVIEELKLQDEIKNIIIVSNVIQNNSFTCLNNFKVFAVRVSSNFFIGKEQSFQSDDGFGPDTADRLFNII